MAKFLWRSDGRLPWLTRAGQRLEAALLRTVWWLLLRVSPARASAAGRRLFAWLGPRMAKHAHVLANLRMVFPQHDDDEIRRIALQAWGSFGAVLAEIPHLPAITDLNAADPAIEIVNRNPDPQFAAHDRPCIFVAAHLGNFHLSAFGIQAFGYPVDVVYSPLTNPYLDALVQDRLQALRCGFITKQNAVRQTYKSLKRGRSVGLHVDVRVDGGELFPFCGADATTTTTPAWLAVKTGCDIVPVHTERVADARFRITFYPALTPLRDDEDSQQAIHRLTLEMNRAIAGLVSAHAGQWQCTKRRWPREVMQERGAYRAGRA